MRYIPRRAGTSAAPLIPISKGFPDLSVLVMRSGIILPFRTCPSKTEETKTLSHGHIGNLLAGVFILVTSLTALRTHLLDALFKLYQF